MLRLQEIVTTRVANLISENRLPLDGRFHVSAAPSNAVVAVLERRNLLKYQETLLRLFGGQFNVTTGVDLSGEKCDEETLWRIVQHGIVALNISGATTSSGAETRLLLPRMVACLPADSTFLRNLRSLDMGGSIRCEYFQLLPMLNRFFSLESLCMSESTDLSNEDLEAVCQHHGRLRLLDLSNCPRITDISCLGRLKRLEVLRLHGLHLNMGAAEISEAFLAWSELTELDISSSVNGFGVDLGRVMLDALDENGGRPFWPRLQTLDLCGLFGGEPHLHRRIQLLVDSHPELRNLSLLVTPVDHLSMTAADGRQLKVANGATATNVVNAIAFYSECERSPLLCHALRALHGFVDVLSAEDCREYAPLVASSMREHCLTEDIQHHGTHCLSDIVARLLHVAGLYYVMDTTSLSLKCCFEAAERFPPDNQIVAHTLRLAHLYDTVWPVADEEVYVPSLNIVMQHLAQRGGDDFFCGIFDDIWRFTFVLATRGDLIEADCRVVPIVVDWIRNMMEHEYYSQRVNAAIAFLGELSVGRPAVCRQIVEKGGVDITFRLALKFVDDKHVYPHALTLLLALAKEQSTVNCHLCRAEFIRPLLYKTQWKYKYKCAAILSHLLNTPHWKECGIDKEHASQHILGLVEVWQEDHNTMMEMTAIVPDLALLDVDVCWGAQLWAIFSIWLMERKRVDFGYERPETTLLLHNSTLPARLEAILAGSTTLPETGKHLAKETLKTI